MGPDRGHCTKDVIRAIPGVLDQSSQLLRAQLGQVQFLPGLGLGPHALRVRLRHGCQVTDDNIVISMEKEHVTRRNVPFSLLHIH